MPSGSRKPTSLPSERRTAANAPSIRAIVAATASSSGRSSRAISAAITSVSEVDVSRAPAARSSERSSSVFVRLPLCASATVRAGPWWTIGCALAQCVDPVVE